MKHKNLLDSLKNAKEKVDFLPSGTELKNPSRNEKFLNWTREQRQRTALAKLKMRERLAVADSLVPPAGFQPSRFFESYNRAKLYWNEFNTTFSYITNNNRFTREDFKRYWLLQAGASVEEIATITGFSIEPINRWIKTITKKAIANKASSDWITQKAQAQLELSGTTKLPERDLNQDLRLAKLTEYKKLKRQLENCASPFELTEIKKRIEELLFGAKKNV